MWGRGGRQRQPQRRPEEAAGVAEQPRGLRAEVTGLLGNALCAFAGALGSSLGATLAEACFGTAKTDPAQAPEHKATG